MKIKCARRNAEIYGVADRIHFICGNFFHVARALLGSSPAVNGKRVCLDGVFLSPPWGGPAYIQQPVFDLHHMCPDGVETLEWARRLSPNVCFFVPRNTSVKQLVTVAGAGERGTVKVELEQNLLNGRVKTVTAYFGDLSA